MEGGLSERVREEEDKIDLNMKKWLGGHSINGPPKKRDRNPTYAAELERSPNRDVKKCHLWETSGRGKRVCPPPAAVQWLTLPVEPEKDRTRGIKSVGVLLVRGFIKPKNPPPVGATLKPRHGLPAADDRVKKSFYGKIRTTGAQSRNTNVRKGVKAPGQKRSRKTSDFSRQIEKKKMDFSSSKGKTA